jgi:flagellar biosynthesis component FlhA
MDTNTNLVIQYAKTTQTICLCLGVAGLLIMIFILSPLNSFFMSSIIGKALILCLLVYMMYYNIQQTNQFANSFNITFLNINDNWGPIKTNVLCSYLYTVFLFFLTVSVFYA